MTNDDGLFDERVAAQYDDDEDDRFDPALLDATAAFLADLAGDGPALEFAIGTGRVALPLAARGVSVHGLELSRAMVAKLRDKPGGDAVPVTIGDMSTTRVDGEYSLVYLVFNTIGNLTTQRAQVDCFRNAAAHLRPGGCFVIELLVPDLQRLPPGGRYHVFYGEDGSFGIDEYDIATQGLVSHHIRVSSDGADYTPMPFRYAWPSELDLMAELAGMRLRERWADWHRAPFTNDSRSHVSVWELPSRS